MEKPYQTLFFDFDGTLHESMHIYYPAFLKGYAYLVEQQHAEPRQFKAHEVSKWLGYSSADMWQSFMPHLPESVKATVRSIVGDEMLCLLRSGKGQLYPDVHQTLAQIKAQGYTLVFISNCGKAYMEAAKVAFQLDAYFDDFICSGSYPNLKKSEILSKALPTYKRPMAIIGDRFHDMEAGIRNHMTTFACLYGYGKSEEFTVSTYSLHRFKDILAFL